MADDKLLHFDTPGGWPRVSEIQDGTVKVYWEASQGIATNDPPTYSPPTDWPVGNTLLKRPRVFRVVTEDGGGGTPGICDVVSLVFDYAAGFGGLESDPGTETGAVCECDPLSTTDWIGLNLNYNQLSDIDTMNQLLFEQGFIGEGADAIDSITPNIQIPGGCEGEGSGGVWNVALEALSLPDRVGKVTAEGLTADYLSPVSVNNSHVPSGPTDYKFIGGEVCHVVVLRSDAGLDNYDPDTVLASAVGLRIIAAYPFFKRYETYLVADRSSGSTITESFREQLALIADKFAPYGFHYKELSPAGDVTSLLAQIASEFYD